MNAELLLTGGNTDPEGCSRPARFDPGSSTVPGEGATNLIGRSTQRT